MQEILTDTTELCARLNATCRAARALHDAGAARDPGRGERERLLRALAARPAPRGMPPPAHHPTTAAPPSR